MREVSLHAKIEVSIEEYDYQTTVGRVIIYEALPTGN